MNETLTKFIDEGVPPEKTPYVPRYEDGTNILVDSHRTIALPYIKDRLLPIQKIYDDPSILRKYNEPDILSILKTIGSGQFCPTLSEKTKKKLPQDEKDELKDITRAVKVLLRQRVADIKKAKKQLYKHKKFIRTLKFIRAEIQSGARCIQDENIESGFDTIEFIDDVGTFNRNFAFDLKSISACLMSIEAYKDYMVHKDLSRLTEEHFTPRTITAKRHLYVSIMKHGCNMPMKIFVEMMFKDSCVVYTTAAENKHLENFQKNHTFNGPLQSYKDAGITLVSSVFHKPIPETWITVLKEYGVDAKVLLREHIKQFDEIIISPSEAHELLNNSQN